MTMNNAMKSLIVSIILASAPRLAMANPPSDGFVPADAAEGLKTIKAKMSAMKAASALQKQESDWAAQKDAVMIETLALVVLADSFPESVDVQKSAVDNLVAIFKRAKDEGLQLRIVAILLVESPKAHFLIGNVPGEGIDASPELYAKALTANIQKTILKDLQSVASRPSAGKAINTISKGN